MNDASMFLSTLLNRGSRALAGYAAAELLESHPRAGSAFGADAMSSWQNWLASRLEELAAAVATEDAQIFAREVCWAKSFALARGVPSEYLRSGIECMRAVLARELPQSVRALADVFLAAAHNSFEEEPGDQSLGISPLSPESRLSSRYLLAVLEGDRRRSSRLILDAADDGRPIQEILLRILLPAQVEIGRMWQTGEINVAEEHFVSETTKTVMAQLMSCAECTPSNGKTMLAASVAGNQIDIGLYAVACFFELDGWRTINLGANVPTADIVQAVDSFDADLLGLSASQSTQLQTVRKTIDAVRSSPRGSNAKIIVGGFAFAGFEHLPRRLGADGFARDPADAVNLGARLVFGTTQATREKPLSSTRALSNVHGANRETAVTCQPSSQ